MEETTTERTPEDDFCVMYGCAMLHSARVNFETEDLHVVVPICAGHAAIVEALGHHFTRGELAKIVFAMAPSDYTRVAVAIAEPFMEDGEELTDEMYHEILDKMTPRVQDNAVTRPLMNPPRTLVHRGTVGPDEEER